MHRRSFASEGTSPKATRRARKRVRDRRAEAQPYKGMSQTKVKSRMYASKFPTERSPVAKCVMIAEANTDAPKSQRYYRLKFADTYYGEMTHYGLYRLAWADVRRAR